MCTVDTNVTCLRIPIDSSCYIYLQYLIFNHMIEKYSTQYIVQLLISIVDVLNNIENSSQVKRVNLNLRVLLNVF